MENDRLSTVVSLVAAMLLAIAWAFVIARVFVRLRDRTRGADDILMAMGLVRTYFQSTRSWATKLATPSIDTDIVYRPASQYVASSSSSPMP
jgi:hypothetical protein